MPRGNSGGRSGSSGWCPASSSSSSSLRNRPKKVKSAPPPAPAPAPVQGNNGSFLGAVSVGIGWGAGSSIGHRLTGLLMPSSALVLSNIRQLLHLLLKLSLLLLHQMLTVLGTQKVVVVNPRPLLIV
ncbi:hypothetical protein SLEP1_g11207 [Rubroshorea leprosula]|uniref:Uncharacterized protein n=1 Tax=Rubroshorea leprosula TaxID=152421 RepID=A0AAV5IJU8_9ROSI|nr:hypothetical protein SLEP1_g11207 [Rubroshorea leprosula]